MTPEKVRTRIRGHDVRNFSWSDDEGEKAETPGKHAPVVQPRPDSQVHFELQDDGTPVDKAQKESEPLKNVTNNVGRRPDFDTHWTMADSSPAADGKVNKENKPSGENHQKAVNMMAAHWDTYDESPEQVKKPVGPKGLRKGQETHWGFDNHASEQTGGKKEGESFWDF
jgi:hypothetical protein